MKAARKRQVTIVSVEEDQVPSELAHLKNHPRLLKALVAMGPELAHRMLHSWEFKDKPIEYLNSANLSPDELYAAVSSLLSSL